MKSSWNIWVDPKPSDMRPHKRTKGPTGTGQVRAEAELEGGSHEPRGAWALGAGRGRRTHTGSLRREGSPAATWTSEPCLPELRESVFLDGKPPAVSAAVRNTTAQSWPKVHTPWRQLLIHQFNRCISSTCRGTPALALGTPQRTPSHYHQQHCTIFSLILRPFHWTSSGLRQKQNKP